MTSEKFQMFLNQFAEAHAETLNVLLLDTRVCSQTYNHNLIAAKSSMP